GCSGLALASGLHSKGIPYKVFERDLSLSPRNGRDWGMACHWASPLLASMLGDAKWSRISEAWVDPHLPHKEPEAFHQYNGKTGELISKIGASNMYRFLRSRLRVLMAEGLVIQFSKKLETLSYADDSKNVTAHFADGTSETGRLVIGADGSQSRVRRLLVGTDQAKLKRLPLAATFVTSSFPADLAVKLRSSVHPILNSIVHPDNMVGMFSTLDAIDKDRPENWQFAFYISRSVSLEQQDAETAAGLGIHGWLQRCKEEAKSFADPVRAAFDNLPDDAEKVYHIYNGNWDPNLPEHAWDNHGGRVTLVGDAAHPMTYHRGQGLNHSLADGFKLVELLPNLENRSQADLIDAYEAEMRPRGGEEVQLSETNSFMMHDWEKVKDSPMMKMGVTYGSEKWKSENGKA
ncbi:hypothetical protein M426DRAFT_52971, partial [Hypoxylon sp. CI-4A]